MYPNKKENQMSLEQQKLSDVVAEQDLKILTDQLKGCQIAALQAQLEEAKYNNILLSLRIKYNLGEQDQIDSKTGTITRV